MTDSAATGTVAAHDEHGSGRPTIIELSTAQRRWIARRIDHVRFVDDRSVERTIELHVDLQSFSNVIAPDDPNWALIPLLTLDSSRHTSMSVQDEAGRILTSLGKDQERDLVASGILASAGLNKNDNPELFSQIHEAISVRPKPDKKDPIIFRLIAWLYRWAEIIKDDEDRGQSTTQEQQSRSGREGRLAPLYGALAGAGVSAQDCVKIGKYVEDFQRGYLLIACVPPDVRQRPMVFKINFLESFPSPLKRYAIIRLLFGTLSVGGKINVPGIAHCRSYHSNVLAPSGFRVVDLALRVDEEYQDGRTRSTWHYDDDRLPMAGHTVASADQNSSRATSALHVNLYSNKTGFFFESLFISIFTSALLIIFSLSFEAHGFMLMSGEIIPLNGDFVAGLVLLFPALAVTIIIQRDSHRLESRTFAVQRLFVLVVAISSAAASLPITLGVSEDDARRYWYTAAITCWILTARIVLSSLIHSWRISHARHRISMKWRSIQKNRNHQPDYQ